jgi:flagellar basal-body rod protein FlgB
MKTISEHLSFHAASLGLRSRRNEILASNIANAATPHFKARDISFEDEIRKQEKIGPLHTSNSRHYALASISTGEETLYRQPMSPSMDGNTVELAIEQIEFSENVVRYQTSLTFLNNRISGLLSAIKGE